MTFACRAKCQSSGPTMMYKFTWVFTAPNCMSAAAISRAGNAFG